jgi:hypothetical protein
LRMTAIAYASMTMSRGVVGGARSDSWFVLHHLSCRCLSRYAGAMGLLELLIIILVLAAIFGGVAVSPVLFVLLIVVVLILFTRGGFGYQRGARRRGSRR